MRQKIIVINEINGAMEYTLIEWDKSEAVPEQCVKASPMEKILGLTMKNRIEVYASGRCGQTVLQVHCIIR